MLDANHYLASYNKAENDIAEDFYLPSMRASCKYDRISGYFGSTVYIIAWPALKEFINNNGKMRIVCSPYVSEADAAALSEGYSARTEEILNRAIEQEVQSLLESDDLSAPAKLLAYLVSKGIVERLLDSGHKVCYLFVALCPKTKRLHLDFDNQYTSLFNSCIEKGMRYYGCGLKMSSNGFSVVSQLEVIPQ